MYGTAPERAAQIRNALDNGGPRILNPCAPASPAMPYSQFISQLWIGTKKQVMFPGDNVIRGKNHVRSPGLPGVHRARLFCGVELFLSGKEAACFGTNVQR